MISPYPTSGQQVPLVLELTNSSVFRGPLYWSLRASEFFVGPGYTPYSPEFFLGATAGTICVEVTGPVSGIDLTGVTFGVDIRVRADVTAQNIAVEFVLSSEPNGAGGVQLPWAFIVNPTEP
jgi:hypothetical protein